MIRLVLFSQDLKLQALLAPALGREFELTAESRPDHLNACLRARQADVFLVDIDPENFDTPSYVGILKGINDTGVTSVLMADDMGRATAIELLQHGAHCFCRKPPAMRELKAVVHRAWEHTQMKRELAGKKQHEAPSAASESAGCDGLIGSSAPMRTVYDLIQRVSRLNASVLITGESGTGKELIARAIHNLGDRRNQPFVAVSCGAIPETLIESELFGHEKGAFTGTNGTRTGYFEQAGGGTLFLDEIGELSPQTQVKLLRVLQQKEFSRLGSGRAIPLKARVLFATHRDLPRMVEECRFRLDLYYRINVVTLQSPSLAERPEDVAILARHFLAQYSEMYDKFVGEISLAALAALEEYEWPGNVRELENVIQSAIICANTDEIQMKDLPERLRTSSDETEEFEEVAQAGTF